MAISTYAELQSALSEWKSDALSASSYPNLILLCEASFNRRLRVRQMETSTTLTPSSGAVALPSDYLKWRSVEWTGTTPYRLLKYVHPGYLRTTEWLENANAERPEVFTIEGSTLTVRPSSDTNLLFRYYQKIPALSDSNTTNWLLTAHPDAYLWGSLCELEMLRIYDERANLWKARRDEVLAEIERLSAQTQGENAVREDSYF